MDRRTRLALGANVSHVREQGNEVDGMVTPVTHNTFVSREPRSPSFRILRAHFWKPIAVSPGIFEGL